MLVQGLPYCICADVNFCSGYIATRKGIVSGGMEELYTKAGSVKRTTGHRLFFDVYRILFIMQWTKLLLTIKEGWNFTKDLERALYIPYKTVRKRYLFSLLFLIWTGRAIARQRLRKIVIHLERICRFMSSSYRQKWLLHTDGMQLRPFIYRKKKMIVLKQSVPSAKNNSVIPTGILFIIRERGMWNHL